MESTKPLSSVLVEVLCANAPCDPVAINADSRLIEMGFDSLSVIILITRIEAEFGCTFTSGQVLELLQADKVRELQAQIEHAMACGQPAA
jgi:acyl carrier protein